MKLTLSKSRRDVFHSRLKAMILDELDLEIGDLKAMHLTDLLLETLGPAIYNQAIRDAQAYLQERLQDMDGVLFLPDPDDQTR